MGWCSSASSPGALTERVLDTIVELRAQFAGLGKGRCKKPCLPAHTHRALYRSAISKMSAA
uniref:Uncharacterized protein n=1 Tax=Anguilla anguilla TaxID=7936 RepID=A0A0E9XNA3_ANGAN